MWETDRQMAGKKKEKKKPSSDITSDPATQPICSPIGSINSTETNQLRRWPSYMSCLQWRRWRQRCGKIMAAADVADKTRRANVSVSSALSPRSHLFLLHLGNYRIPMAFSNSSLEHSCKKLLAFSIFSPLVHEITPLRLSRVVNLPSLAHTISDIYAWNLSFGYWGKMWSDGVTG